MTKFKTLIITILILFLCTFTYAKKGQGGHPRKGPGMMMPHHGNWWHDARILEDLDLNDNQLEKINDIQVKAEKKIIKKGAVLAEKMIDLKTAMGKTKLDENKITKMINEISKIHSEMYKIKVLPKLEVLKVLTVEQRKKLKKKMLFNPMGKKSKNRDFRKDSK